MGEYDFKFGRNRDEKIDKYLDNLGWFFHSKPASDYTARAVEKLNNKLDSLNENFKKADESSSRLSSALNKLTLWGIIVAGSGVAIAIANFIFELIKYVDSSTLI